MNDNSSNIFVKLSTIPPNQIVQYVGIFVLIMFVSKIVNISSNTVYFALIALIVLYVIHAKYEVKKPSVQLAIEPTVATQSDIKSFLSETNNYYYANKVAYADFVENLDNFFRMYNQFVRTDLIYPMENAQIAIEYARTAQNHFSSLIYSLEPSNCGTHKFHLHVSKLDSLLNKYIKKILLICNKSTTRPSDFFDRKAPKPRNYADVGVPATTFDFF